MRRPQYLCAQTLRFRAAERRGAELFVRETSAKFDVAVLLAPGAVKTSANKKERFDVFFIRFYNFFSYSAFFFTAADNRCSPDALGAITRKKCARRNTGNSLNREMDGDACAAPVGHRKNVSDRKENNNNNHNNKRVIPMCTAKNGSDDDTMRLFLYFYCATVSCFTATFPRRY